MIDNIENKFRQINENIERIQEEAMEMVFDKLERTLDNINRQNSLRSENGNKNNDRSSNNNNIQNTNIFVLNGINNTYDRKNFKGRPKFALLCSYFSSHGHTKGRCFKRPRRESIARPKERSFFSHMRNNQNLPNRRIDSNNINGRQLPSTSPVYHNSRSRTQITDYNQEIIRTTTHIAETIDTIKDIAIRIITVTLEAEAIIETIITGAELTVTTETIIITNTTIADQAQDTQTAVTQDSIHRTTEIIIIIITITIIDKDIIVKIQTKVTDTDSNQVVTIDNILRIIIGMTEETQRKENKMIDIIQKIEEQTEINTTITKKTE